MGLGLNSMGSIQTQVNEIVDDHNVKTFPANEMVDNVRDITLIVSNIVVREDEAAKQEQKSRLATAREKYGKAKKLLLNMQLDETETKLLEKLDQSIKFAWPLVNKAVELGSEHKNTQAVEWVLNQSGPATQVAIGVIDEIVVYERDSAQKAAEEAKAGYANARNLMLAIGGLAIVFGTFVVWFITRSITRPINDAVKVAEKVAAGDLTSHIEVTATRWTRSKKAASRSPKPAGRWTRSLTASNA